MKNKTAKVKVKLFGQEIEQFGITSDDKTITSDVIADYINTHQMTIRSPRIKLQITLTPK